MRWAALWTLILCATVTVSPLVAMETSIGAIAGYGPTAPDFPAEVEERASDSEVEERRGKQKANDDDALSNAPVRSAPCHRDGADGTVADKARHTDQLGRAAHGLRAPPA